MLFFFLRFDSETHEFDPDESTFSIPTNEVKVDDQLFLMKTRYFVDISVSVTLTKCKEGTSQTVGKIL